MGEEAQASQVVEESGERSEETSKERSEKKSEEISENGEQIYLMGRSGLGESLHVLPRRAENNGNFALFW